MSCEASPVKTTPQTVQPNWLEVTSKVLDSGSGTYEGLKAGKLALKWIHTGRHFLNLTEEQAKAFERGSEMLGSAANATILTKYPFTLSNFQQKGKEYSYLASLQGADVRDITEARDSWVAASADVVGDAAKIGMLMTSGPGLETVSYSSDLVADVSTAKLHHSKVTRLGEDLKAMKEKPVAADAKIRVVEERRHSMLKVAKCMVSVVGSVLGLGVLLFGLPISSVTLLSVTTLSFVFTFWAHFYKESMTHALLERNAKLLTA